MDVFLSETDGMLLLKEIRKMNDLPIITMSSKGDLAEKAQAISFGADDFLIKLQGPDDLEDCMLRTQSLIRRYTELNHIHDLGYRINPKDD